MTGIELGHRSRVDQEREAGLMKPPNWRKLIRLRLNERKSGQITGWHGFGVFDKAVSSWFDNVSEEHGITEDDKTVPPFSRVSVTKAFPYQQHKHPIF